MTKTSPRLGIIGVGRVGGTLARLLHRSGYEVAAVYNRHEGPAEALAAQTGAHVTADMADVVAHADLVLLTVADDAIQPVAQSLAGCDWRGKGAIHTSGAHSVDVLDVLIKSGAVVGSLHPALPFAATDEDAQSVSGAAFAVEADDERLRGWLHAMVTALGGHVLDIPADGKARYHAALALASNYTVTLYAAAERLLAGLGADESARRAVLDALVSATVENIRQRGIPDALTGPLVRADLGTLAVHLDALRSEPEIRKNYIALARLSYPMLIARGVDIDLIEKLFHSASAKEDQDASDHP